MLLCLDLGNTHVFGGVFEKKKHPKKDKLVFRFRYATSLLGSADQFGVFLMTILNFHGLSPARIVAIALSSVVPNYDYTLKHCFTKYFKQAQCFFLQSGVEVGLNILCKNPSELGADRIANAIGAMEIFPQKSIIVVDMGTATTLCVINENRDYLGGAILPGMKLCMEALTINTAKLMAVNIEKPMFSLGKTTQENIQSGLYYGHLGALRELISQFKREVFSDKAANVIGTGGFSQLYEKQGLFDVLAPELVLRGLKKAFEFTHKS